jgi:hypothetical protein
MNGRRDDCIEFMRECAVDGPVEDLKHKARVAHIERAGNARPRKRMVIDGEGAGRVRPARARVIGTQGNMRAYAARAFLKERTIRKTDKVAAEFFLCDGQTKLWSNAGGFTACERDSR